MNDSIWNLTGKIIDFSQVSIYHAILCILAVIVLLEIIIRIIMWLRQTALYVILILDVVMTEDEKKAYATRFIITIISLIIITFVYLIR